MEGHAAQLGWLEQPAIGVLAVPGGEGEQVVHDGGWDELRPRRLAWEVSSIFLSTIEESISVMGSLIPHASGVHARLPIMHATHSGSSVLMCVMFGPKSSARWTRHGVAAVRFHVSSLTSLP